MYNSLLETHVRKGNNLLNCGCKIRWSVSCHPDYVVKYVGQIFIEIDLSCLQLTYFCFLIFNQNNEWAWVIKQPPSCHRKQGCSSSCFILVSLFHPSCSNTDPDSISSPPEHQFYTWLGHPHGRKTALTRPNFCAIDTPSTRMLYTV